MTHTKSSPRGQFSVEALFYLLALATLIITFVFLFSTTADKIKSRQNLPAMRLAGNLGDLLVLDPDSGLATRNGAGHALSHACDPQKNITLPAGKFFTTKPSGSWTYCVTRACSVDSELRLLYVCV